MLKVSGNLWLRFLAIPGFPALVLIALASSGKSHGQVKYPGCEDLAADQFRKVTVATPLVEPLKMAFLPDGRLMVVERRGPVKIVRPGNTNPTVAWEPKVFWEKSLKGLKIEDGNLGIAIDPGFTVNKWIYLYYSPPSRPVNRLSRFTLDGDKVDTTSEKILLEVEVQRDYCCHTGGGMGFDAQGNLYLTTGDNTASEDAYGAINEKPDMVHRDAQRSSANTNDLRGKLLRIKPTPDGKYSIPAGNLFPPGTARTRPEIYSMGHRNPYTLHVDKYTGWAHIGEVGPDADIVSDAKGPAQHEEFNLVKQAGNFGWPYMIGNNQAYKDFNYITNAPGPAFNPDALVNNSPNNTGLGSLPAAVPAILSREFGKSGKSVDGVARFPNFTGTTAITGPVYYYDGRNPSSIKLPPHFDRKWIQSDFGAGFLNIATLDMTGERVTEVLRVPVGSLNRPVAFEVGPDGALYVIEYASANFQSTASTRIIRIEYTGACRPATPVPPDPPPTAAAPETRSGRLVALVEGGRAVRLPSWAAGFSLYDLRGALVWEYRRDRGEVAPGADATVSLPRHLSRGLWRLDLKLKLRPHGYP